MTTYERGDVVEAGDPFDEDASSRPFLVVNTPDHPFAGEQYVAVTLTTRTWYDETIPLDDANFVEGGVPKRSFIVPWGVASPGHGDVLDWFGRVDRATVDGAVERLVGYLEQ